MQLNIDKKNWRKVKLGDVAFEYRNRINNPSESEFDRFVGSSNIGQWDFRVKSWESTDSVTSSMKLFEKGDYLLVRRSLYASDFRERAPRAHFNGVCSGDILTIKENPEMLVDGFLIGILNSPPIWKFIVANASGSITRRIKWKDLANYEFLLPPKEEQARLAELLWAMDEVVERDNNSFDKIKVLIDSFAASFFKNRNEKMIPLQEVGEWKSGGTPNKKESKYWGGEIPWVSPKDMKRNKIIQTIDKITILGAERGSTIVPKNSILMVVRGMILAHTFPVAISGKRLAFNQDMKALIPGKQFHFKILYYFLKVKASLILSLSSQSSHGTKSIPSDVLFSQRIPLISHEEQEQFLLQIEFLEKNWVLIKKRKASSQSLQKSLINQIF